MKTCIRAAAALSLLVLIALPCASAGAATVSPLPASDYTVRPACPPPTPGRAGCLALELVPTTSEARARAHPLGMTRRGPVKADSAKSGTDGLRPEDLRAAYFPGESPAAPAAEPQTIALVDAYNDPNAQADLEVYEKEFGLSQCPAAQSSCFEEINQKGETANPPFPASEAARQAELAVCENQKNSKATREAACRKVVEAEGWAVEISTDIQVARSICRNCKVLLVEASEPTDPDLEEAEETAVTHGASEISNSWGGEEPTVDRGAFKHPGVAITAAAGDGGYLNWTEAAEAKEAKERGEESGYFIGADYPASSPHVIAVGGTKLTLNAGVWQNETVWNDDLGSAEENYGAGGSGCSSRFEAKTWQREVPDWSELGCGSRRAVADVSADGDPYSGVAVYDSVPDFREEAGEIVNTPLEWWPIGGTSVASPIVASMFALAGGGHGVAYPAQTLYTHLETHLLHPVTAGGNGECDNVYTSGCTGSMNPLSQRFAFDCGEGVLICNSAADCEGHYYDGPAGVGTPNGIGAFRLEEHPPREGRACEPTNKPGSGAGSGTQAAQPEAPSGSPFIPETTAANANTSSATAAGLVPVLSALTLTSNARAALNRHVRLKVSRVAFAFTLNVVARVHVTLAKQVTTRGRKRWQTRPYTLTIAARRGRDSAHLSARGTLAPGRYRLRLAPAGGVKRELTFVVG
jgi:Subtilase family